MIKFFEESYVMQGDDDDGDIVVVFIAAIETQLCIENNRSNVDNDNSNNNITAIFINGKTQDK